MDTIRLFTGCDKREAVGLHVFMESVLEKASVPVAITPITDTFSLLAGGQRDGTNAFTYGRFLVPSLMKWKGIAIFADGVDMLCRADIAELGRFALENQNFWGKALLCVKHDYKTRNKSKYAGTGMQATNEDYPRKNWSSLMVMYCGHSAWMRLTPEKIRAMKGSELHRFSFLKDEEIGELPLEWNWLVGEYGPNPSAKILHYTLGIPGFKEYENCDHADVWKESFGSVLRGMQWPVSAR